MLSANYPNPFSLETHIGFGLPAASEVRLVVFDMLGREVARLVDAPMPAGRHTVAFDGADLSSGLYVYTLEAGDRRLRRTMVLVK